MEGQFSAQTPCDRGCKTGRIGAATHVTCTEGDTLIFLDEIQAAPNAITSLKYFYENAPGYHVVAAGSLLGIELHKGESFPVGKVHFLSLYPMSFNNYEVTFSFIKEEKP